VKGGWERRFCFSITERLCKRGKKKSVFRLPFITFSENVSEAGDNIAGMMGHEAATLELFCQSILLPDLVQVLAIIRDLAKSTSQ